MFTKDEVIQFLRKYEILKNKNIAVYSDLDEKLTNPRIKEKFDQILFLEKEHRELLQQAIDLIQGKL